MKLRARWLALLATAFAASACARQRVDATSPASVAPKPVPDATETGAPASAQALATIEAEREALAALGAVDARVIASDVAGEGDRVGAFVELPRDACLVAYARAAGRVEDLDLLAFDDEGALLAGDEAADPRPALALCPPLPARAWVSARVAAGRGLVVVATHVVPARAVPAVARALGARVRTLDSPPDVGGWPGLDALVATRRAGLGGSFHETRRTSIPLDPALATRVSTAVEAGRCVDVLVAPGEDVAQLEVVVFDAEGHVVGRAPSVGRERAVLVCAELATTISLAVRPHVGRGFAAVVLATGAPPRPAEADRRVDVALLGPPGDLATARKARAAALDALGYSAPRASATLDAVLARRVAATLALAPGCSRVDVVAGAPALDVRADAWSPDGSLLASSAAGMGAPLFVCGPGGRVRVDVVARVRPGPVALEARDDGPLPASAAAHPLAASRLLARLASGSRARASALTRAARVALHPTRASGFDVELRRGSCVEATAALDLGAEGLSLRVIGHDGVELASDSGPDSASVTVCGDVDREGAARVELRGGSVATALVLTTDATPAPPAPRGPRPDAL